MSQQIQDRERIPFGKSFLAISHHHIVWLTQNLEGRSKMACRHK